MATVLFADTDPGAEETIHKAENICHTVGLGVIVHHEDEELKEILDLVDSPIVTFSPNGHMALDEMVAKYGENILIIVGGFTDEKDFESDVYSRATDVVSLGSEFLPIPEVIEKIIEAYEKKAEGRGE
jgi:rRNA pseudouridine-1189 N-methylase Emg1 (Nep1/Mra1 family)